MKYEEVKKNLIDNFFNTHYLWACCTNKDSMFKDIVKRIPFNVNYVHFADYEILEMDLGDGIKINFKFSWEERPYKNTHGKDMINYRLVSIS